VVQQDTSAQRVIELEKDSLLESLPPRQKAILELMASGHTAKEIAAALDIADKTVHTHRERLMRRLRIFDVPSLLRYAMRLGFGDIGDLDTERTRQGNRTSRSLATPLQCSNIPRHVRNILT
jgi:DNA-binding CsgD family transcriptional regulator